MGIQSQDSNLELNSNVNERGEYDLAVLHFFCLWRLDQSNQTMSTLLQAAPADSQTTASEPSCSQSDCNSLIGRHAQRGAHGVDVIMSSVYGPIGEEQIMYEGWTLKQSRWIGQWRRRWLVLTPLRLVFFSSERGYRHDELPTEAHHVSGIHSARTLTDDAEIATAAGAAPLACMMPGSRSSLDLGHVIVQLATAERSLLLLVGIEGFGDEEREQEAEKLITAVVNASSHPALGRHGDFAAEECDDTTSNELSKGSRSPKRPPLQSLMQGGRQDSACASASPRAPLTLATRRSSLDSVQSESDLPGTPVAIFNDRGRVSLWVDHEPPSVPHIAPSNVPFTEASAKPSTVASSAVSSATSNPAKRQMKDDHWIRPKQPNSPVVEQSASKEQRLVGPATDLSAVQEEDGIAPRALRPSQEASGADSSRSQSKTDARSRFKKALGHVAIYYSKGGDEIAQPSISRAGSASSVDSESDTASSESDQAISETDVIKYSGSFQRGKRFSSEERNLATKTAQTWLEEKLNEESRDTMKEELSETLRDELAAQVLTVLPRARKRR